MMQNILLTIQKKKTIILIKRKQVVNLIQDSKEINDKLAYIIKSNANTNAKPKPKPNAIQNKYTNIQNNLIVTRYINNKIKERADNLYDPSLNNKKILVLVATHTNTPLKLKTIKDNLNYFKSECIDIAVINSTNLPYNSEIKEYYENNNIKYFEIDNDNSYDFGKWIYLLDNIDYKLYDYVIFTNDSFIIHDSITQFINLTAKSNVELFGYNDSTQRNHHYQSYLFSIKSGSVYKLIKMFNNSKHLLKSQEDVVTHMELKLTTRFNSIDCYLKIGNFQSHKKLNIFFTSDELFNKLKNAMLLPFTKIKRIKRII